MKFHNSHHDNDGYDDMMQSLANIIDIVEKEHDENVIHYTFSTLARIMISLKTLIKYSYRSISFIMLIGAN